MKINDRPRLDAVSTTLFSPGATQNYGSITVLEPEDCQLNCDETSCLWGIGETLRQHLRALPRFDDSVFGDKGVDANAMVTPCDDSRLNLAQGLASGQANKSGSALNVDTTASHEYSTEPVRHSQLIFGDGFRMSTPSVPPGVRYHYPADRTWHLRKNPAVGKPLGSS